MQKTKVVHLGQVRDLLAEWEKVRAHIISGDVGGFHVGLRNPGGGETIYIGGSYHEDPQSPMRTILKVSAARMMKDPPIRRPAN